MRTPPSAESLLAGLRNQVMADGEEKQRRLLGLSTPSRHSEPEQVNSGSPRERKPTTVNIDPNTYGYQYQAALYCPTCIVQVLIDQGEASPAAAEMTSEDVLDQVAQANAIDRDVRDSYDSDEFPKALGAYDGLDDETCNNCGQVLY